MLHPMLRICLVASLMGLAFSSRLQNTASTTTTPTDLACLSSGKNYTTMFVQTGDGLDIIRKTDGTWKLKLNHASRSTMW